MLPANLVRRFNLTGIDIHVSLSSVVARANPTSFHPLVSKRREEAFAAAGGEITIAQATKITEDTMKPVAVGRGGTIEDALTSLEAELRKL